MENRAGKPVDENDVILRKELNESVDHKIEKEPDIDEYHYHEILDRLSIIMNNVDEYLCSHPVCEVHNDLKIDLKNVIDILYKQYQKMGQKFHEIIKQEESDK